MNIISSARQFILFFLLTAFVFLSGCGGGGGSESGGSDTANSEPFSGETDYTKGTVRFSEDDDSFNALPLAFSYSEGILQATHALVNQLIEFVNPRYQYQDCLNVDNEQGELEINLLDNDNSLSVTVGDTVELIYIDCYDPIFKDYVDGTAFIDLTAVSTTREEVSIIGGIRFTEEFLVITDDEAPQEINISGNYRFDYLLKSLEPFGQTNEYDHDYSESLLATAEGDEKFNLSLLETTESLTEFSLKKTYTKRVTTSPYHTYDTFMSVDIALYVTSDLLQGEFSCEASEYGNKDSREYLTCYGINGNAIRTTGIQVPIGIDSNSNGRFNATELGILSFDEILDGYLFSDAISHPFDFPDSVISKSLEITVNDIIYDQHRDRMLISSIGDRYANSLLEYNLDTQEIRQLMTFEMSPNKIALSHDGSNLYVTFTDKNIIRKYDSDSLILDFEVNVVGSAISKIETSPTRSNQYAVSQVPLYDPVFGYIQDLKLLNGQALLDNSYATFVSTVGSKTFERFVYSSDGNSIIRHDYRFDEIERLLIDVNGIVAIETLKESEYLSSMSRTDNFIFDRNRIYDEVNFSLDATSHRGPIDALNLNENRAYGVYGHALIILRADNLSLLNEYRIHPGLKKLVEGPSHLFIVAEKKLIIVDKNVIESQESNCSPELRTNENGSSYSRLECDFRFAVYDEVRDKIYATVGYNLNGQGNSVAIINSSTLEVESFIPILSSPTHIALSGNGEALYVISESSSKVARIDLISGDYSREYYSIPSSSDLRHRNSWSLFSNPQSVEELVVAVDSGRSCIGESLISFKDGVMLPNELAHHDIDSYYQSYCSKYHRFGFDSDGSFYSFLNDRSSELILNVNRFSLNESGLNLVEDYSLDLSELPQSYGDVLPVAISNGVAFLSVTERLDLFSKTYDPLFDLSGIKDDSFIYYNDISISTDETDIFYLSSSHEIIGIDYETNELLGTFSFDEKILFNFEPSLINLPNHVVLVAGKLGVLYLIDKDDIKKSDI